MLIQFKDYNKSNNVLESKYRNEWNELKNTLESMPLYIKLSDQYQRVGSFIFNPVGTNNHIKKELQGLNWSCNMPIPQEYSFLGIDVDFCKRGVVAEVQFSNYPFLLNNLVRSELFYKSKTVFVGEPVDILIIIAKAHMFPASNSTLYYEQAVRQLDELFKNDVFDIPVRLVGLFAEKEKKLISKLVKYDKDRYSRTVVKEVDFSCVLHPSRVNGGRCIIQKSN